VGLEPTTYGLKVGRRPQIKKSFTSIEAEQPYQWGLVSPHKLVPSEWAYLSKLAPEGHPTKVIAWDQARLDSHLAKHADLVAYLQRTPSSSELPPSTTRRRRHCSIPARTWSTASAPFRT